MPSMNAAETLCRLDEIGASNLVPLLQRAVRLGSCVIPETAFTLVCNDANPADPRFSVVGRNRAEREHAADA